MESAVAMERYSLQDLYMGDEDYRYHMTAHDARAFQEHANAMRASGDFCGMEQTRLQVPTHFQDSCDVTLDQDLQPSGDTLKQPLPATGLPESQDAHRVHGQAQTSTKRPLEQDISTRPRLTAEQTATLEDSFLRNPRPSTKQKLAQAMELGLTQDKVNNWYQNRRAKSKQQEKHRRTILEYNGSSWNDLANPAATYYNSEPTTSSLQSTPTMPSSNEAHQPLTPNEPVPSEDAWSQLNMLFSAGAEEAAAFQYPHEGMADSFGLRKGQTAMQSDSQPAAPHTFQHLARSNPPGIDPDMSVQYAHDPQFPIDPATGNPIYPDWLVISNSEGSQFVDHSVNLQNEAMDAFQFHGHGQHIAQQSPNQRQPSVGNHVPDIGAQSHIHQPTAVHPMAMEQLDNVSQMLLLQQQQQQQQQQATTCVAQFHEPSLFSGADSFGQASSATSRGSPTFGQCQMSPTNRSADASPVTFATYQLQSDSFSRRPSEASELAMNLGTVHLQRGPSQSTSDEETTYKTPPMSARTLAARRKQRPTSLATRAVSTGALQSLSPACKTAGLPVVRRMRSAGNSLNLDVSTVINGRIQKSGTPSAQRSPLYATTFQEATASATLRQLSPASPAAKPHSEMLGSFQATMTPPEEHQWINAPSPLQTETATTFPFSGGFMQPNMLQGAAPYVVSPPITPYCQDEAVSMNQWHVPHAPVPMAYFPGNPSPPLTNVHAPPPPPNYLMLQSRGFDGYQQAPSVLQTPFHYPAPQNYDLMQQARSVTPLANYFDLMAGQAAQPPPQKPLEVIFSPHRPPAPRPSGSPKMQRGPQEFTFQNLGLADLKAQYRSGSP